MPPNILMQALQARAMGGAPAMGGLLKISPMMLAMIKRARAKLSGGGAAGGQPQVGIPPQMGQPAY